MEQQDAHVLDESGARSAAAKLVGNGNEGEDNGNDEENDVAAVELPEASGEAEVPSRRNNRGSRTWREEKRTKRGGSR